MRIAILAAVPALVLSAQGMAPTQAELDQTHAYVLALLRAERPGADAFLNLMEKRAPKAPQTLDARKQYDAAMRTRPGQPAPAFKIANLEDPSVDFTLDTLKGKTVLLEFWATWCPYCVGELPELHDAWNRYQGGSFEILSFSMDDSPAKVAHFRQDKFPMPWKHALLAGAKENPIAQAYWAAGIPRYVLIGPDGRILASGASLRGKAMAATLAKFLPSH